MSSSAPARERRRLPRRRSTVTADLIYDGFYAAAVGGSALGLFFLLVDSVDGQPFFTPSLMGTVLFTGVPAESVTEVSDAGEQVLGDFLCFFQPLEVGDASRCLDGELKAVRDRLRPGFEHRGFRHPVEGVVQLDRRQLL